MAGFYGGDTEQMRSQAQACELGAQRIHDMTSMISAAIDAVPWFGPDAVAMRALWHGTVKPGMIAKAEDIRAKGVELDQHATEQDRASGPTDLAGLIDVVGDILRDILPLPTSSGLPIGPHVLDNLRDGLGDLFRGGGSGEQEFYGGPGYGSRGQMFGEDRPVGTQFEWNPTIWDGPGFSRDGISIDPYGGLNYSAGTNVTTDDFGNTTGTFGARGSGELGITTDYDLPFGFGMDSTHRIGMEAYGEGGGTMGPDGFSGGARARSGLYAEQNVGITHDSGASAAMTTSGWVGADAHANAHSHATRNADGNVNGWTSGFDVGAFSGAQVTQKYELTSPGGWFTGSTSISEKAGAGAGLSSGYTVSTDEVSFSIGGHAAKVLGLGGSTSIGMNPNAIVDSFTPGDYNLDDALRDGGAFIGDLGDATSKYSPFW